MDYINAVSWLYQKRAAFGESRLKESMKVAAGGSVGVWRRRNLINCLEPSIMALRCNRGVAELCTVARFPAICTVYPTYLICICTSIFINFNDNIDWSNVCSLRYVTLRYHNSNKACTHLCTIVSVSY